MIKLDIKLVNRYHDPFMRIDTKYDVCLSGENVKLSVPSIRLADIVKEDVLLLKVDVEGWEWGVFEGAAGLIRDYKVENVIMEYSPGE